MGFFLEADKQDGEAEDTYEDGALLFRNEMDTVLDDGDHNGHDHQEDFDWQALKADWRQQIGYPITRACDGQAEDHEGRQENDEAFPSPEQTSRGSGDQDTRHDGDGMDILNQSNNIHNGEDGHEQQPCPVMMDFLATDAEQCDAQCDESHQEEDPVVRIKRRLLPGRCDIGKLACVGEACDEHAEAK